MPSIKLPTGSVHYTEHGQGVPLVLLHANPGDSKDFEAVVPALSKTYRVLALDWPGYGQSAPPQQPELVGVLFFYHALREFLAALALPPAFFIGNSLGGNAAARLAAESPELVRGLVLVAPGGFTTPSLVSRNFCKLQGSRFSLSPHCFASLYLKHRTATTRAMLERASTTQAAAPQIILNRAVWRGFTTPDNDLRTVAPKSACLQHSLTHCHVATLHLQRCQSYFWKKYNHFWRHVVPNNSFKPMPLRSAA